MIIATWNVNSITVRLPQVLEWLTQHDIDVLALQETKVVDLFFPAAAFEALGYHVYVAGEKSYNGVAIISKFPIDSPLTDNPFFVDPARRFLAATVQGVRLVNLYVPNGQSVLSDKYLYKLAWLEGVTQFLRQELEQYPELMVVGDFNIAPTDQDVHDPSLWAGSVLVSPAERAAFQALLSLGLSDTIRYFHPEVPNFTWWDYRQGAFRRNLGLRIDHVLLSRSLLPRCHAAMVDILPRKATRPSDHAPVWVEILFP